MNVFAKLDENYLFIFRELGSTVNYFRGAGKHCQKVKKIDIRLPFYLIL